jgi:hypothetical protein
MSATAEKASILALLHDAYPRHTAKLAASAADVPLATAKAWASGRFTPSAEALLRMAARCDQIADALQRTLDARRAARVDDRRVADAGPAAALAPLPALIGR